MGPSTLVFTRQAMPTFDRTKYASAAGVAKGAYILSEAPGGKPDVILMGSGSELSLCVEAADKLNAAGIKTRVVSMPSWELFEQQDAAYKESVFPASVSARVSVEMASTFGWERYVGLKGKMIGNAQLSAHSAAAEGLAEEIRHPGGQRGGGWPKKLSESELAMKIVVGSDHAGFQLKVAMGDLLRSLGATMSWMSGAFNENPSDYPDFAEAVGHAVLDRKAERGVLICGSGVGASVAANKLPGIRAGMCHDTYSAHQGVEHDDINVLVLGERV